MGYYDDVQKVAKHLNERLQCRRLMSLTNLIETDPTYGEQAHSESLGVSSNPGFDLDYTIKVMDEWIDDRTHDDKEPSYFIVNFSPLRAFIALRAREIRDKT